MLPLCCAVTRFVITREITCLINEEVEILVRVIDDQLTFIEHGIVQYFKIRQCIARYNWSVQLCILFHVRQSHHIGLFCFQVNVQFLEECICCLSMVGSLVNG